MTSASPTLSRQDWARLVLGASFFFGLLVRLFPALLTGFPLNDGGMILTLMRDLRSNGFVLPSFTSYNLSDIPFAYPPLGAYLGGMLSVLGVPELEVLRWLPLLANLASIPAFYLLSREFLKDDPRAAVAALVFSLVPGNYAWQIMGGGMTRAFGLLFYILAALSVFHMLHERAWKFVGPSSLFCALAVLSHPEAGLATAVACWLFWLWFGRSRDGLLKAALVALGTILLTAPWWGSVIAAHGLEPFAAVFYSGDYRVNPFKSLLLGLLSLDSWTGLFRLLSLVGLIWSIYRRQYFLPLWLALPYFVEPRHAASFAFIPGSILAAQVLADGLPAARRWLRRDRVDDSSPPDFTRRNDSNVVIFSLLFLWFVQSALFGFRLANTSLRPPAPQQAMFWTRENTPSRSIFLILTGKPAIMSDPMQEWFPSMAGRKSHTTLQGLEWTLGAQFFPRLEQLAALQFCRDLRCVEDWSSRTGLVYTHLLLERNASTGQVIDSLLVERGYRLVYENDTYLIFELIKQ